MNDLCLVANKCMYFLAFDIKMQWLYGEPIYSSFFSVQFVLVLLDFERRYNLLQVDTHILHFVLGWMIYHHL